MALSSTRKNQRVSFKKMSNTKIFNFLSSGVVVLALLLILVTNAVYSGWKEYQADLQFALQQKYIAGRVSNNLLQLQTCFEKQNEICRLLLNNTEIQLALLQNENLDYAFMLSLVKHYVVAAKGDGVIIKEVLTTAKINNEVPNNVNDVETLKTKLKERYEEEIRRIRPQKITEIY